VQGFELRGAGREDDAYPILGMVQLLEGFRRSARGRFTGGPFIGVDLQLDGSPFSMLRFHGLDPHRFFISRTSPHSMAGCKRRGDTFAHGVSSGFRVTGAYTIRKVVVSGGRRTTKTPLRLLDF
jgi:hypothetical protein